MLMKMRWIFILILVGVLTFLGCPTGNGNGDSIRIISVTPNSGLTNGVSTTFVVDVEFRLSSVDNGEINLGFNTEEVDRYKIIRQYQVFKDAGQLQQLQFIVTVVVKNWGNEGDFAVYVNLSEFPHDTTWTPLATDIMVLTFPG